MASNQSRRAGRLRLRLRAVMALVAAMSVLAAFLTRWLPDALWRHRLERLITTKVEGDAPGDHAVWMNPSFQLYHGLSGNDLDDFRRDPGRVVDRLFESIGRPGAEARRRKVLRSLEIYLDEVEGPEQPRRFIAGGVELLASGTLPIGLETDLASSIAGRSGSFGMTEADRRAFRERARVVLKTNLPHPDFAKVWAWSLAQLGGREEKEIVLGAWDRLDHNGRVKVFEAGLVGVDEPRATQ